MPVTSPVDKKSVSKPETVECIAHRYWQGSAGRATLLAARCCNCGQHFLPSVAVCSTCEGVEFDTVPLSEQARLYIFSVIHAAPAGYDSPYCVGYADFPEEVRVFGHVRLDGDMPPQIDGPVAVEAADLFQRGDGTVVRGYRFVPVSSGSEQTT